MTDRQVAASQVPLGEIQVGSERFGRPIDGAQRTDAHGWMMPRWESHLQVIY